MITTHLLDRRRTDNPGRDAGNVVFYTCSRYVFKIETHLQVFVLSIRCHRQQKHHKTNKRFHILHQIDFNGKINFFP